MIRSHSRAALAAVLCVVLLLGIDGCRGRHADPSTIVRVRVLDCVPGRLDIAVNGRAAIRNMEFRSGSGYWEVDPGHYTIGVSQRGGRTDEASGELSRGSAYTVLAIPSARTGAAVLKIVREHPVTMDSKRRATLRFVSASPDCASLSLALDNIITVDRTRFAAESLPVALAPGDYDAKLWTGDDRAPLFGPSPIRLQPGRAYTLVAMGLRTDGTLSMQLFEDQ
jgi:hypothetical protein